MRENPLDKTALLEQVIAQVQEALRRLASGYAVARQATLDSPHVMKSKRDVTGIEASYLANALAGNIQEREFWLRTLRRVRLPEKPQRVALGCVVAIGPRDVPAPRLYFLLPVCGGMELALEGGTRTIRIITPESPVAKALIGKEPGEAVELPTSREGPEYIYLLA